MVDGVVWLHSLGKVTDHNSISYLGPALFGLYAMTADITGTLPRMLTTNFMNTWHPSDQDWRHVIYEKYEIAMMDGQHYNWDNYGDDVTGGGG